MAWLEFGYYQFMELLVMGKVVGPMLRLIVIGKIFQGHFQTNILQPLIQQNTFGNVVCQNVGHFIQASICLLSLTHWFRVTHICISKLTIISSGNGLRPGRGQAIIWTSVEVLIGSLGTNFSEILIELHQFLFKKVSKMAAIYALCNGWQYPESRSMKLYIK